MLTNLMDHNRVSTQSYKHHIHRQEIIRWKGAIGTASVVSEGNDLYLRRLPVSFLSEIKSIHDKEALQTMLW